MKLNTKKTEGEHKHIWKYFTSGRYRICEPPFPTIESCGKVEYKSDGQWYELKNEDTNL